MWLSFVDYDTMPHSSLTLCTSSSSSYTVGIFLTVLATYTLHQRHKAAKSIRWGAKKTIIVSAAAEDVHGANGANNGNLLPIV